MNIRNEETNQMNTKLKIFYISIIIICIVAVFSAVIIQIKTDKSEENSQLSQIDTSDVSTYKDEFDNIFENKVNYLENNGYKITKIEQDKEIVYAGYQIQETKLNNYELDVNVPYINIKNDVIEEFNESIKEIFEQKAKSVLNTNNENIIYTVNYCAYVTNNILSLVIRSTLKEGNNAQRDIVQTYNYDLTNQKEYTIDEILEKKGITKREANEKIKTEIESVQNRVEELNSLGYNVYSRDVDSDIYNISNVTEYFIGEDDALYIIFAYGNENNTTEMDIVVM